MADYEFDDWAVAKTIGVQSASERDSEVTPQAQSVAGHLAVILLKHLLTQCDYA